MDSIQKTDNAGPLKATVDCFFHVANSSFYDDNDLSYVQGDHYYPSATSCDYPSDSNDVLSTEDEPDKPLQLWLLWLLVFPVVTLVGNVLVCLSVFTDRNLHTATNYFIVSLAFADIMVGILVMPFAVYNEVNNWSWTLGDGLCDMWVAFDVLCCTASILNLAAISFDRFVAITRPLRYAKHRKSRARVYTTLALTWVVSAVISSPIAFGMNRTERREKTPSVCTFYNSDFLIFSSMGSFYIPCVVMLTLYWRMFRTIRQRAREAILRKRSVAAAVNVGAAVSAAAALATSTSDRKQAAAAMRQTFAAAAASLDDGCQAALLRPSVFNDDDDVINETSTLSRDRRGRLTPRASADAGDAKGKSNRSVGAPEVLGERHGLESGADDEVEATLAGALEMLPVPCALAGPPGLPAILLVNPPSPANNLCRSSSPEDETRNGGFQHHHHHHLPTTTSDDATDCTTARTSAAAASADTADRQLGTEAAGGGSSSSTTATDRWSVTRLNFFYARYLPAKRRDRNGAWRERKATKTLAIVLGVFLVCWAPFFTINIINAVCIRQSQTTVCATAAVAVAVVDPPHVDAERQQSGVAAAASPSSCPQEESEDTCRVNPVVMSSFVWLGYINSALNPVIYTIFNVEFRRAFDRLLRRLCTVLTCRCWDRCDAAAAAPSSSLLRTGSSLKG